MSDLTNMHPYDQYHAIYQRKETQPVADSYSWISIHDERNPEGKCLVVVEGDVEMMWSEGPTWEIDPRYPGGKFKKERFSIREHNDFGNGRIIWETTEATHWMPFPTPPTIKEQNNNVTI